MVNVPLVQDNEKQSINTSIISIKKNLQINDSQYDHLVSMINEIANSGGGGGGDSGDSIPIGAIMPFYLAAAPNKWLECNGDPFDETVYSELYALLGTNVLPDFRECTLVGVGLSGNNYDSSTNPTGIQEHDVYTLGQFKDDQMQKVEGTVISYSEALFNGRSIGASGVFATASSVKWNGGDNASYGPDRLTFDTSRVARTGTTTHGKQVGVMYCIKAIA